MLKTIKEIKKEFAGQWVCLINIKYKEKFEEDWIDTAEVIVSSKSKEEIIKKWSENKDSVIKYIEDENSLPVLLNYGVNDKGELIKVL